MSYKYANHKAWVKWGRSSFITAIFSIIWLTVDALLQGEIHPVILVITMIVFLFALIQGMQYINMDQKDYIRIEDGVMLINRGFPILPRKKLPLSSIERYIEYYPLLIFKLKHDRELQINIDWLTEEAVEDIKHHIDKTLDDSKTKV
ncbi:hypothetical protein [Lentibacillus sp. CBA3610]|uniref:hypothetical protein n=1 Tax=Lentibacillus sp. CBA3610 TaxID=2518176 RepID=UPI0015959695|nr:hypothetical protein [Lentibacillus sp. CBA3610]QKY70665.1 hypothetical protein Len3610_14655 [Lentibacillus sp. CBA3610]